MRRLPTTLFLFLILGNGLRSELIEFPAASTNKLEVAAGSSIQINYASGKGDAADYIKLKLKIGGTSYECTYQGLNSLYVNGPASIEADPVVIASYSNIPYKFDRSGNILKDTNGSGQYTIIIQTNAWIEYPGGTTNYSPETQEYLNWINAGNTPLPANAYTGNGIANSGILIHCDRYTNQPYKTIVVTTNSTETLTIPAGKKVIGKGNLRFATTTAIPANSSIMMSPGLVCKIRDGYEVDPAFGIEGPEVVTLTYTQTIITLGAGGSATTTTGSYATTDSSFGIFAYYFTDESSDPISESTINSFAKQITGTSGNYGLATKVELNTALTQSRSDGINNVLSNPNLWTLYTVDQIQNMAMGNLVLNKNTNGVFSLNYDIEQSTDLQTWTPYQALSLPLSGLPTNKAFVRIKLKNSQ